MTPQELLKPRVICIGNKGNHYPHSPFTVGEILYADKEGKFMQYEDWGIWELTPNNYPHLFRSLQWWEHRKPEDMPEYVKGLKVVKKVNAIEDHGGDYPSILCEGETIWSTIWMYEPATLEEYNSYLKTTK